MTIRLRRGNLPGNLQRVNEAVISFLRHVSSSKGACVPRLRRMPSAQNQGSWCQKLRNLLPIRSRLFPRPALCLHLSRQLRCLQSVASIDTCKRQLDELQRAKVRLLLLKSNKLFKTCEAIVLAQALELLKKSTGRRKATTDERTAPPPKRTQFQAISEPQEKITYSFALQSARKIPYA